MLVKTEIGEQFHIKYGFDILFDKTVFIFVQKNRPKTTKLLCVSYAQFRRRREASL